MVQDGSECNGKMDWIQNLSVTEISSFCDDGKGTGEDYGNIDSAFFFLITKHELIYLIFKS